MPNAVVGCTLPAITCIGYTQSTHPSQQTWHANYGTNLESGDKEAVIKFENESAASTACLLNNALIDGANVRVEYFPIPDEGSPRTQNSDTPVSYGSRASIFSGIAASTKSLASSVVSSVKGVDEKYGVIDKVTSGASTAWESSKKFAKDIDEKYHVKDNVSSAYDSTKKRLTLAAGSIRNSASDLLSKQAGQSPRRSPTPQTE